MIKLLILTVGFFVLKIESAYDEKFGYSLFLLSASSYVNDHEPCLKNRKEDFLPHKFEIIDSHNEICDENASECAYFIVVSNETKQIVVSFRGSYTGWQLITEGWKSLFESLVQFYTIGRVNSYFNGAFSALYDNVEIILKDENYKDFNVSFTGHSLGGTFAVETILREHRTSDQVSVYTYGQPRTGNSEYAFNFDKLIPESYRIVFKQDPVPHVPFCDKKTQASFDANTEFGTKIPCNAKNLDYPYHHGVEIFYPNEMTKQGGGDYVVCSGNPKNEDLNCSDGSFPSIIWPVNLCNTLITTRNITSLSEFGKTCLG
ncbi:Lipase-3 domain-containing protein [Aphelenchoides bicaudatus]|nr:Lipase-3 domain-containing protein [Aphelenchoides bicaudatus]